MRPSSEQGKREGEATTLALSSLTPCLPAGREGSVGENRQFRYEGFNVKARSKVVQSLAAHD